MVWLTTEIETMRTTQRLLEFDVTLSDREQQRQERCRRILSDDRLQAKVNTASRYFDDVAYREATALAEKYDLASEAVGSFCSEHEQSGNCNEHQELRRTPPER